MKNGQTFQQSGVRDCWTIMQNTYHKLFLLKEWMPASEARGVTTYNKRAITFICRHGFNRDQLFACPNMPENQPFAFTFSQLSFSNIQLNKVFLQWLSKANMQGIKNGF